MERFGYFMVRLHHADDADAHGRGADGARIAGLVERLASGEKRAFASGAELLRLLHAWPAAGLPGAATERRRDAPEEPDG